MVDMDSTDALNLWDIEIRIKTLHEELEILHQMKEELLFDRRGKKLKWESNLPEQNICE